MKSADTPINIVIYESSSFGGCYEYAKYLFSAYRQRFPTVMLLPRGAAYQGEGVERKLVNDQPNTKNTLLRKGSFLYRNVMDPLLLFFFLLFRKKSLVILNDFEQLTAPLWVPLFRLCLSHHEFGVLLHDPDRDNYPPSKGYSIFCMKLMMGLMDYGYYHGYLPDKPYYRPNKTRFINVPHGLYPVSDRDEGLYEALMKEKNEKKYAAILGNIRHEKNYDLAIRALKKFPGLQLIIAGSPSSSEVQVSDFKQLADKEGVGKQVTWIIRFLSDEEMSTIISVSDVILLNYSHTFTSQSGIINLIAPYKKPFIYSETASSLTYTAKKFKLGIGVKPDDVESFEKGMQQFFDGKKGIEGYEQYLQYASWDNHVGIVMQNRIL